MKRALCRVLVLFSLMVLPGCGGARDYSGAQRFPLSGEVTFDGEPVDWGSVSFIPLNDKDQRPSGGVIENGKYSVPEEGGANAGKHRIEIHWSKKTGKQIKAPDTGEMVDERVEVVPAKFNTESELTAEVSEDQTKFDFHLKSN